MFCSRCGTWAPDDTATCTLCGMALEVDNWGTPPGHDRPLAPVTALVDYGGFWRRFAALLLDAVVLFFPSAVVRVLLGLSPLTTFDADLPASWLASVFELLLNWLYAAVMMSSAGRGTLGMLVMDLHVTDLAGDRITFLRATGRSFAQVLSLITFGLGYLMQPFAPRRQTLHDLVAGTVVVRPRREPASAPVMRLVP